ncbi:MAG: hypothetical protein OEX22_11370 [Cyclobacteriaceae bacterium]|nr:hypothetical protein [Cyclobacteriaceae bacterium]
MIGRRNITIQFFIGILLTFIGCSKDSEPAPVFGNGTMSVVTSSSATNIVGATISEFRINIETIRFRTIIDDPLLPDNTIQVAPLVGPFELVLIGTETGSTIDAAPLPNATYDRIKFDLMRGNTGAMNNISILIQGQIGTTPFEMWHDTKPTFQQNLNNVVVNGNALNFGIDFVLDGLDLSGATDGDANGLIEISPNDNDGNNNLADDIAIYLESNFIVSY